MEEVGNTAARRKYEERVPACYRRPTEHDPQSVTLPFLLHEQEKDTEPVGWLIDRKRDELTLL